MKRSNLIVLIFLFPSLFISAQTNSTDHLSGLELTMELSEPFDQEFEQVFDPDAIDVTADTSMSFLEDISDMLDVFGGRKATFRVSFFVWDTLDLKAVTYQVMNASDESLREFYFKRNDYSNDYDSGLYIDEYYLSTLLGDYELSEAPYVKVKLHYKQFESPYYSTSLQH